MKIAWASNRPDAPSGYGSQTRQVARRIAADGHGVEFLANDGVRGDYLWEGMPVRGSGMDRYSRDTIREDVRRAGADWTVVLYDAWVYTDRTRDPLEGMRVAGWMPVDHYPCPPTVVPWASQHLPVAMSRFGFEQLAAASDAERGRTGEGFPVRYAPHAVDRAVYRPRPVAPGFGRPFRQVIGVPEDAFLVGIVAANTGTAIYDRKGFGDMVPAVGALMDRHPDAHLYLHSHLDGHEGISLRVLLGACGVPADRLHVADQHLIAKQSIADPDMAAIYTSLDVLLGTSRGEGFGLPHLEAQACGTPVILSNWTASAELVGDVWRADRPGSSRHPSGWLVEVDPDWDHRHGASFGKPRIPAVIRALEDAHAAWEDPAQRAALRDAALANAARWDADAVYAEHWRPILAEMASMLDRPQPERVVPINRAARRQAERERERSA